MSLQVTFALGVVLGGCTRSRHFLGKLHDSVASVAAGGERVMVTETEPFAVLSNNIFILGHSLAVVCRLSMDVHSVGNQSSAGSFPFHFSFLPPHPPPPTDTELTNLNWVAGAPVPMQNPVSPTRKGGAFARSRHLAQQQQQREDCARLTANHVDERTSSRTFFTPRLVAESRLGGGGDVSLHSKDSSPAQQLKRDGGRKEKAKKSSSKRGRDNRGVEEGEAEEEKERRKKPNCSYTSLIGLALMASEDGCLPVSEIYTYIE